MSERETETECVSGRGEVADTARPRPRRTAVHHAIVKHPAECCVTFIPIFNSTLHEFYTTADHVSRCGMFCTAPAPAEDVCDVELGGRSARSPAP
jgi:hypothetical protein